MDLYRILTLFLSLNLYQWVIKQDYSFTGYIIQNLLIVTLTFIAGVIAYLITKKYIIRKSN